MAQQLQKEKKMTLDTVLYCKYRRKQLPLRQCLDDYLDANALGRRRAACWRCVQGKLTRTSYSEGC